MRNPDLFNNLNHSQRILPDMTLRSRVEYDLNQATKGFNINNKHWLKEVHNNLRRHFSTFFHSPLFSKQSNTIIQPTTSSPLAQSSTQFPANVFSRSRLLQTTSKPNGSRFVIVDNVGSVTNVDSPSRQPLASISSSNPSQTNKTMDTTTKKATNNNDNKNVPLSSSTNTNTTSTTSSRMDTNQRIPNNKKDIDHLYDRSTTDNKSEDKF
jgi:hypothetical protein